MPNSLRDLLLHSVCGHSTASWFWRASRDAFVLTKTIHDNVMVTKLFCRAKQCQACLWTSLVKLDCKCCTQNPCLFCDHSNSTVLDVGAQHSATKPPSMDSLADMRAAGVLWETCQQLLRQFKVIITMPTYVPSLLQQSLIEWAKHRYIYTDGPSTTPAAGKPGKCCGSCPWVSACSSATTMDRSSPAIAAIQGTCELMT
jgi:hypothetical protein